MKNRNYHIRKPDPLLLLALVVGFGVVVTTTAQAADPAMSNLKEAGAQLAIKPVQGLAERLDIRWLNTTLENNGVRQLLMKKRLGMGKPFGAKGPELNMSWRPRMRSTAAAAGDSGIGAVAADRPDVYFSLRRSW
ncbi:MAG: hypothetical protein KKA36_01540 [Gammaproteobacteria bacterium]|nr:hypothetical protein [Gammaproteobacteria bacterium]MBU2477745.1 hypothetical protein [Gammaproteobacteria bacterium]